MYTLYSYTPATDTETSTPYDTLATAMEAFKALAFRLGKTGTDTDLILYHGDRCNALAEYAYLTKEATLKDDMGYFAVPWDAVLDY